MSKATETCPICHNPRQRHKYCERCRDRVFALSHERDYTGNFRKIDSVIDIIRAELGVKEPVKTEPVRYNRPNTCPLEKPCPEYGNPNGVCMLPRRKDGGCAKMDGFKTKRHEWV